MVRLIKQSTLWSIAALLTVSLFASSPAQAYPDQPIKIIVTFPPGGSAGSDRHPRVRSRSLRKTCTQPIVIENKAGAGGNIGMAVVAQATPDGYTLASPRPACSTR